MACLLQSTGISFLDLQDLATVAAQTDFAPLISAWCCDSDTLLNAVEAGLGACVIGFVIRWRGRR